VVVLTMGLSVFKQGRVSVQHLQDSGTKAEHTVQRKHCDVAVLQGRSFNSATGQAAGLLLGVLRLHAGAPCPVARRNRRQAWRRERDIGGEGATDSSSRRGVVQRVAGGVPWSSSIRVGNSGTGTGYPVGTRPDGDGHGYHFSPVGGAHTQPGVRRVRGGDLILPMGNRGYP
jgi:hypothetical protein